MKVLPQFPFLHRTPFPVELLVFKLYVKTMTLKRSCQFLVLSPVWVFILGFRGFKTPQVSLVLQLLSFFTSWISQRIVNLLPHLSGSHHILI